MRRSSMIVTATFGACMALVLSPLSGCSGANGSAFTNSDGGREGGGGGAGGNGGGGGGVTLGDSGGSGGGGGSAGEGGVPACPPGLMCNVSCSGKKTTTITGKVYDPAMKNALYNIQVYVPAVPLVALPKGVPTGSAACSCGALFQSGAITNTSTAVDGTFTLPNVPVGAEVPLVLQIGKWRRSMKINVKACEDNAQPDKTLYLPSTVATGDIGDNIPDIAVSTGSADTLECLMLRIGLPKSEYVAGTGTGGHVHVFSGGQKSFLGGSPLAGTAESPPMSGAPTSWTALWSTYAQLMPYDIVLLSCEGGETYDANPPALEAYLNAGGRAFGSHFHYAFFSGPLQSSQGYFGARRLGEEPRRLVGWQRRQQGGHRRRDRHDLERHDEDVRQGRCAGRVAEGQQGARSRRGLVDRAAHLPVALQREGRPDQHGVAAVDHGGRRVGIEQGLDDVLLVRHAREPEAGA